MAEDRMTAVPVRPSLDQPAVRRNNLSLVLRALCTDGSRSRARLADATGLTKATVSSLVADLAERGLVRDGATERLPMGRPAQLVDLVGAGACGVGAEINVDYIAAAVVDLAGELLVHERRPIEAAAMGPTAVLDALAALVRDVLGSVPASASLAGGVTVALPGGVDAARGVLAYAPNLGWTGVSVVSELGARLGPHRRVRVDNEANLAALGEFAAGSSAGTADLVLLTGEVGVGGGVISGGRLLRGGRGYAGEVGHMLLDPQGERCGCGRRGCWETVVGLWPLLRAAAPAGDPLLDPHTALDDRLADLVARATAGDPRTLAALDRIGTWLGLGASLLVNVLDPRVLVLGGYFATLGPWLAGPVERELAERAVAGGGDACRVEVSALGFDAAIRGGAHVSLGAVLDDPTLVAPGSAVDRAERAG